MYLTIMNNAMRTWAGAKYFFKILISISLAKYPRTGITGSYISLVFIFKTSIVLSKAAYEQHTRVPISPSSTDSDYFCLCCYNSHPHRSEVISTLWFLFAFSLMVSNVEHFHIPVGHLDVFFWPFCLYPESPLILLSIKL